MPTWQDVFHKGLVPLLSEAQLRALETALETDDCRLIQGVTCEPYHYMHGTTEEAPVTHACLLGLCVWAERVGVGGRVSVGDLEAAFSSLVTRVGVQAGDPLVLSALLDWYDKTPRGEMRARLLPEVRAALVERSDAGV